MRTKCPYCAVAIFIEFENERIVFQDVTSPELGWEIAATQCPSCGEIIVVKRKGELEDKGYYLSDDEVQEERIIYPATINRPLPTEVPEPYHTDFKEAASVLGLSPKASAALSRRILQTVLEQKFNIKKRSLDKEIEEFLTLTGVPTHLSQAVDAVRTVGNFAAHPIKDTQTGTIVDVEPGEAEWLLDVLEALFDFAFVQPKKLKQKRQELNEKLQRTGKPPLKG